MFCSNVICAIVRENSLFNIRSIANIQFVGLSTLDEIHVKHHFIITKIKCWDYRELSNLSTGYARLQGRFLCITTSSAMVAPRYARATRGLSRILRRLSRKENFNASFCVDLRLVCVGLRVVPNTVRNDHSTCMPYPRRQRSS